MLALLASLAGTGSLRAAPIVSLAVERGNERQVTKQDDLVATLLTVWVRHGTPVETTVAGAGRDSAARADETENAFLRELIAGPRSADVLAMVSAGFRGSAATHMLRPFGVLCVSGNACGLAELPSLAPQLPEAAGVGAAVARTGFVPPPDPLDISGRYGWGGAAARTAAGAGQPEETPARLMLMEVLAWAGLDQVLLTLRSMPAPFAFLALLGLIGAMVLRQRSVEPKSGSWVIADLMRIVGVCWDAERKTSDHLSPSG